MTPSDGPTRFKSRFSLLSLLPSRHPPLVVSQPIPIPEHSLHQIARHPTIISESLISPVQSQYAIPSTPRPRSPPILPPWDIKESLIETPNSVNTSPPTKTPKRPPPIDLERIKKIFPSPPAFNEIVQPQSPPKPVPKAARKQPKLLDDPFDFAEVEVGHRYPSWQGGKVDIKPGQVLPHGILGKWRKQEPEETYDSVLHNILLTPTYFRPSPSTTGFDSPSPLSHRSEKRRTLIGRATETFHTARHSRWLSIPKATRFRDDKDRVIQQMREREQMEMDRYRRNLEGGYQNYTTRPPVEAYSRKSPGWVGKMEMGGFEEKKWWKRSRGVNKEKAKKSQRVWKWVIILVILCFAGLIVGLCVSLINKTTPTVVVASSNSTSTSVTSSTSAPIPTATSQSLLSCLQSFQTSAPTSPLAYSCSDCVPLLVAAPNDYLSPLANGNSTGVGAALQFCALMDVYRAKPNNTALGSGWATINSPCGWNGIGCDPRGRVTTMTLRYPSVPDKLPTTLGNIVSLQAFHLMGNSAIPTGTFPTGLLSLPDFTTLDLEYTALSGLNSGIDFSKAAGLVTLVLANNKELGTSLPSFGANKQMSTLAITGQKLTSIASETLPNSLTYLDLSFNSLTGTVPALNQLTSLKTLYLQSNSFTSPPSSLPSSLTTLSLTSNPNLTGSTSSICSLTGLTSCDLRSTALTSNATSTSTSRTSASASASSSATWTITKNCGVCLFV